MTSTTQQQSAQRSHGYPPPPPPHHHGYPHYPGYPGMAAPMAGAPYYHTPPMPYMAPMPPLGTSRKDPPTGPESKKKGDEPAAPSEETNGQKEKGGLDLLASLVGANASNNNSNNAGGGGGEEKQPKTTAKKGPSGTGPKKKPKIDDSVGSAGKNDMLFIDCVRETDVLCGRGGKSNHHAGNKRYRQVVSEMKRTYQSTGAKTAKTDLSRAIVEHVVGYGGRFIKRDDKTGNYFLLTKAQARRKTSQALRETKELKWTV